MKRAKTLFVSLAAGALALSLLTSCSGMEHPGVYPGWNSSGNWTGGTFNGTTPNGNGSNGTGNCTGNNNVVKDPNENLEAYRAEVLRLINQARAERGIVLLKDDDAALTEKAQKLAEKLPENFTYHYCTEQVAAGYQTPECLVSGLLSEGGSYLLRESYTKLGVGFYYSKDSEYGYYWDLYFEKSSNTPDPGTDEKDDSNQNDNTNGSGNSGENNDSDNAGNTDAPDDKEEDNTASLDQLSPNTVAYRNEVLRLVNIERKKAGLNELTMTNTNLLKAAQRRANEIAVRYNPPHTRLDGRSWSTVLAEYNVFWRATGENMAAGYQTPAEVVEGWMNSPGHRANILNENFNQIGIGYAYRYGTGYNHYWIQIFTN